MSRSLRLLVWVSLSGLLAACAAPVTGVPAAATPARTVVPAGTAATQVPTPPPASASATAAPNESAFFTHPDMDPAIPRGAPSAWDSPYTDPGAVVFHDGQFHMLRNGFRAWPAAVQIGYVTSPDGITWTRQGEEPVLRTDQVPYAGTAALASSVLVQDDGTWVLYFYTWERQDAPASGAIGRATAPGPAGPWQVDAAPVLTPGPPGEWDDRRLTAPDVVRTEDGYRMFYSAVDASNAEMIGLATSPDGIMWTKYDDPATGASPFAHSDPVLRPGDQGTWDAGYVHQPRVTQGTDGWVMFYRAARQRAPGEMRLGYATSPDGIRWTRFSGNPVLSAKEIGRSNFWFTNVLYHNGTYFLYWEIQNGSGTDIHVATHAGTLGGE